MPAERMVAPRPAPRGSTSCTVRRATRARGDGAAHDTRADDGDVHNLGNSSQRSQLEWEFGRRDWELETEGRPDGEATRLLRARGLTEERR